MSINPCIIRKQALGFWNLRQEPRFLVFCVPLQSADVTGVDDTETQWLFVSALGRSIIVSAEILTPQLASPARQLIEGEVLRSYSNNPAVNTISVSQGEFYGSPSTMRKAEKNEKSFNLAPLGKYWSGGDRRHKARRPLPGAGLLG